MANHLRYYVRQGAWPEQRAEIRLVVNAGSVLEAPDQKGLAHAVEHMVFRGTKRFPGHAVDDYLLSVGMRAGSDINATTNADETVYRLTVPTDRIGVLDTALLVLADMAGSATFDSTEATKEAGVVLEEWRWRTGAAQRISDARDALLLAGSPYADHSTIGDTAIIRRFDRSAMRRFYDAWYRPELMAVIAVGDFDPDVIERLIGQRFGGLSAKSSQTSRVDFHVAVPKAPRAAAFLDAEARYSRIGFWYPQPPRASRTVGDFRADLIDEIWRGALRDRLEDRTEDPGSPILDATVDSHWLVRPLEADVVAVLAADGRSPAALGLLATELSRLATRGVSDDELRREKATILRARRAADASADRSGDIADKLELTFFTNRTLTTNKSEFELASRLLPTITGDEVRRRAARLGLDSGATIIVTSRRDSTYSASPTRLVEQARRALDTTVHSIVQQEGPQRLVRTPPVAGAIVSERNETGTRVFEWALSNGMRVILKPTRFGFDDIELRLVAPGGASLASDADYPSAYFSDEVVASVGVGDMRGRQLARRLDATSVEFSSLVRDDWLEITANAAPRDLELLFQTLYLHFTAPRNDTAAFRRFKERHLALMRGRANDPDDVFMDSVSAVLRQHQPRGLVTDVRSAASIDLKAALGFWRARVSNAANFTVVITGDFALSQVRPLITTYLASLPAGRAERPGRSTSAVPVGIIRREFAAGHGAAARTEIILSGPYDASEEQSAALSIVSDVAERALGDRLREELGGTYGVSVTHSITLASPRRYRITVQFEASPDRMSELSDATIAELKRLATEGPSVSELEKVRAARVRDLEGKLERNTYWADELVWHAQMGWPSATILNHQDQAKHLTTEQLRDMCRRYLAVSEYVQVTMRPTPIGPH